MSEAKLQKKVKTCLSCQQQDAWKIPSNYSSLAIYNGCWLGDVANFVTGKPLLLGVVGITIHLNIPRNGDFVQVSPRIHCDATDGLTCVGKCLHQNVDHVCLLDFDQLVGTMGRRK
jgi:hypothetical protein